MLKLLIAASLTLAPMSSATPQTVAPLEPVPLVSCGNSAGSAFRIGPHVLLSVNHVTSIGGCMIDGQPIKIAYASAESDFSILFDDRVGKWIPVDCGGFVAGRHYIAIGHARGLDQMVGVEMVATGETANGQALLVGVFTAQPGQSGGPIIDAETRKVVGTVNTGDWEDGITGSVELRGTSVCRK